MQQLHAHIRFLNVDIERQNSHFSASTEHPWHFPCDTPQDSFRQINGYGILQEVGCRTVGGNGGYNWGNLSSVPFYSVERFHFSSALVKKEVHTTRIIEVNYTESSNNRWGSGDFPWTKRLKVKTCIHDRDSCASWPNDQQLLMISLRPRKKRSLKTFVFDPIKDK